MKKNDIVRNDMGWLGKVAGFSNKGTNVDLVWQTGKLKGKQAKVLKALLKVAAK